MPKKTQKAKFVIESKKLHFKSEDCGNARVATIYGDNKDPALKGFFVRLLSGLDDEDYDHPIPEILEGKRVRVTVEVI